MRHYTLRAIKLSGICLIFFFLNTGACEEDRKYGEECVLASDCDEQELLGCQNGVCSCSPSLSFMYDDDLRKCVARVGERCGSGVSRGDWTVTISCTDGALCDESGGGYCVCTDDFFRLPNGTCSRKRKYMETCNSDLECGKDNKNSKLLVCDNNGVCNCDRRFQIFDQERRQCVTLVGGECNSEISQVASSSNFSTNECSSKATCIDFKCACEKRYVGNSKGLCQLVHGEPCGVGRGCSDIQFTCLDGTCQCKYPLHQIYDEKSKECRSLVAGPCTLDNSSENGESSSTGHIQHCTKNMYCLDQGFFASCECLDGFVQKKDGQCAPGYNESCEADECDPITPLYCRNNRCNCRDELQVYDKGRRKCLGLVGSRCTVGLTIQQCVEFSSCIQVGADFEGKCLCDKYSEEVENRTCIYE